jgi:hypothetical protein
MSVPSCTLTGARLYWSAWASVFAATKPTPPRFDCTIVLRALPPPPPTPITLMTAFWVAVSSNSSSSLSPSPLLAWTSGCPVRVSPVTLVLSDVRLAMISPPNRAVSTPRKIIQKIVVFVQS